MQHLDKSRVIMVDDLAVSKIQLRNLCHIFIGEVEIPDIHILFHTVFVYGFRDHDHASFYIPAKSHLRCTLSIFIADLCQHRMGEDSMVSFRERSPCFRNHSVFLHNSQGVLLLEEWMQLYLINSWNNLYCLTKVCQACRIEIAYTDCFQLSFFVSFF